MNKAKIVKDNDNEVYLVISGKPLDGEIYFHIDEFTTEVVGKIVKLSKEFDINLREE
jgi:hypothetical protein